MTKSQRAEMKASATFPAEVGETWTIRDGSGRTVEKWTVRHVSRTNTAAYLTVEVEHVRGEV